MPAVLTRPRSSKSRFEKYNDGTVQADSVISIEEFWEMPEQPRYELIEGELYFMSDPTLYHQLIRKLLERIVDAFLIASGRDDLISFQSCNVRLFPEAEKQSSVIPDFTVGYRRQTEKMGFVGAPLWLCEVLSPSNRAHDTIKKLALYERAGVPEYWIIDPKAKTVEVHLLSGGTYGSHTYHETDTVSPGCLPGLGIGVSALFAGFSTSA
jgi:Uma2 family endonuclease